MSEFKKDYMRGDEGVAELQEYGIRGDESLDFQNTKSHRFCSLLFQSSEQWRTLKK